MGTVPQAYFSFIMDYAPYFYYIPGTGVDTEWGRGPAPAAHAIDFLTETYQSPQFEAEKTGIYFSNDSIIECFPNNPDTIRGPTLHLVYWDEMNFTANDEEMYDAILFTLGTTNGKFVCSSTPWSTDHMFYRIFNHQTTATSPNPTSLGKT